MGVASCFLGLHIGDDVGYRFSLSFRRAQRVTTYVLVRNAVEEDVPNSLVGVIHVAAAVTTRQLKVARFRFAADFGGEIPERFVGTLTHGGEFGAKDASGHGDHRE